MSSDQDDDITGQGQTKKIIGAVAMVVAIMGFRVWNGGERQRAYDLAVDDAMSAMEDKNEAIGTAATKMMKADCRAGKLTYSAALKKPATAQAKNPKWCLCVSGQFRGYAVVEFDINADLPPPKQLNAYLKKSQAAFLKDPSENTNVLDCVEHYRLNPKAK